MRVLNHLSTFFSCSVAHPYLHSFPTRRSSDLRRSPRRATSWTQRPTPPRSFDNCGKPPPCAAACWRPSTAADHRSEEHTSELQSLTNLVCRLLLEKKKQINS